jgi:hypothetical protein
LEVGTVEAAAGKSSVSEEQQQQQHEEGNNMPLGTDGGSGGVSDVDPAAAGRGAGPGAAALPSLEKVGTNSTELAGPPSPAVGVAPPDPVPPNLPAIKTHVSQSSAAAVASPARSAGSPRSGASPRRKAAGPPLPHLVVSSVESREVVLPGLMRLEADGGMLLIQV